MQPSVAVQASKTAQRTVIFFPTVMLILSTGEPPILALISPGWDDTISVKYFLLLYVCTNAFGQENLGLQPDRPGFTSPSGVVGMGILQLENGYTFESARPSGTQGEKTVSGPQTLLRFGLTDRLEIRYATNGYSWQSLRAGGGNISNAGASDSMIGGKLKFLQQSALLPEMSFTGGVSVPTRGSAFTSSGYDPQFSLAAVKDLPRGFIVAANGSFGWITDTLGRFSSRAESVWVSHRAGPVTVWAEAFHTAISRTEGYATAIDGGIFKEIGRNIQVDAGAGHTVSGSRPAWFATIGFVFRDPYRLLRRG